MTSGDPRGTSGAPFWLVLAVLAPFVVAVNLINVFTLLDDFAERGFVIEPWKPWLWEFSSGAVVLTLAWIPWLAVRRAPPGRAWPRFAATHAVATLGFTALHIAGLIAIREAAYAALRQDYRFGLDASEFLYEYRKDLMAYLAFATAFWLAPRLARREQHPIVEGLYVIRDGSRTFRLSPSEIVAVSSAGNYVEFSLADGRRLVKRATLAAVDRELAPYGLVRTHRSWLVNPKHVREVRPTGSGDFTLALVAGLTAPLSRRFPETLEKLTSAP